MNSSPDLKNRTVDDRADSFGHLSRSSPVTVSTTGPRDGGGEMNLDSIRDGLSIFMPIKTPATILEDAYRKEIKEEERFLLAQLESEWKESRPFANRKILINGHMTLITLAQIKLLISAGAEVEVAATPELVAHQNAVDAILEAGLAFYRCQEGELSSEMIPEDKRKNYYDIVYDCGAGMLNVVTPKVGMVELTHTDPALYTNTPFPVITVDNSETKHLETGFGTGDSLVRVLMRESEISLMTALRSFVAADGDKLFETPQKRNGFIAMLTMINMYQWLGAKHMIFGYGKVGKGIANALKHAGVSENNIYIVEVGADAYLQLKKDGFTNGFRLDKPTEKAKILALLKDNDGKRNNVQFVITATGVANAISRYFELSDFADVPMLINMGTPDEFGSKFSKDRVLNDKQPANFMLSFPTEVRYLDPIFCIWAHGGRELVNQTRLANGLSNIRPSVDAMILDKWMERYPDFWAPPQARLEEELRDIGVAIRGGDSSVARVSFSALLNKFGAIQEKDAKLEKATHTTCNTPRSSVVSI